MAKTLTDLIGYLDHLEDRAPLAELTALLNELEVNCDDLAKFVRFSERHYMRNLVRSGQHYHLLVLCWRNGQRSPIHDHAGSSCGVRVLRGTATETFFEFAPNGHVKATFSRELLEGQVCGSQDSDMHQVSNLQGGDEDLVTLHVYSPPLMYMSTYSINDRSRGVEPMFVEFGDAGGI